MEELKKQEIGSLFVPYEIASALKELGFDECCFATYNADKKVNRNPSHNMEDLPIEGQPYYWNNSKIHIACITAPLYQQAFKFFRDKYDLYHFITREVGINTSVIYFVASFYKGKKGNSPIDTCIGCQTYEEAELECIKKLIEICKKN